MNIRNKRVLITGATGAIGTAITGALAKHENNLLLHFHNSCDKAEILKKESIAAGSKAKILSIDLSNAENAAKLAEMAHDLLGKIDLLIDTSSTFNKTPFGSVSESDWDEAINTNLKSKFFLSQAIAEHMDDAVGRIILFSDIAANKPYGNYLPYCISKAGIDALVRGLSKILAPTVLVNGIAPYIVTRPRDMSDEKWNNLLSRTPANRPTSTDEILDLIDSLCSKECKITGRILTLDGKDF
ncbi:MAG: SDR family NAD(P)-dependent oxidoreductase [Deltaproteobacteria bacterium]|jgi:NAD(P)-dependent dehydrogenase (short-subunit alcohol dehydrogenase family)|nr:SDR family NAD(P)-dependent oxidoreductase [Deltaproteobacteria bacterium]